MASKPSPPPPLTPEEFSEIMAAHRQWLYSGGQEGHQAELVGVNLQGLDLSGYNLSGLDFREANLARVKFGDAHVEGANFRSADLQEADLSGVRGLLAPQLAGADLAGARLQEGLKDFAALKHVDAASSHVQKIFFLLLSVCVYCWLTIAITTDASLLNNFADQALPIIGTKINLVMFYWAAPFLLLCVYLYFHLCLQRLWEALAELPAVFPDGLHLPHRVHPWLWNGLVWAFFPRLRDRRPPLLSLQKLLAIFLVWWAGPVTILALWWRYLPAYDLWPITILQLVFLTLALDGALGFSLLTRATLGLKKGKSFRWKRLWRTAKVMPRLLTTAAIAGLFLFLSLADIEGLSDLPFLAGIDSFHGGLWVKAKHRESYVGLKVTQWEPGDPWVRADLSEAEVSLKPPQWKPGDLDLVRGAFLRGRNLRGASAYRAFLVKADLSRADLRGANLLLANLQHADLRGANLQHALLIGGNLQHASLELANLQHADLSDANLWHAKLVAANLEHANLELAKLQQADLRSAKLQQADLNGAKLQQANLDRADFQGALGLQKDQVRAASCWQLAYYSPKMLKVLELPPEHNKNIKDGNLSGYQLSKADLRGAYLREFNLRRANLHGADLEGARLYDADLAGADLRDANLKGAYLREAKGLTRAQLKSVIMDGHTQLPEDLKDLVPSGTKKP